MPNDQADSSWHVAAAILLQCQHLGQLYNLYEMYHTAYQLGLSISNATQRATNSMRKADPKDMASTRRSYKEEILAPIIRK